MMQKTSMILRLTICGLLFFTVAAFAAEPKLTLYVPFNGSAKAAIAGGNGVPRYGVTGEAPQFADGIAGQGFLTGGTNQNVTFDAAGNISPDQWTITFWVKGQPGAEWNKKGDLQGFWELNGEQGEIMWFYKYLEFATPWLFSRPKTGQGDPATLYAPQVPEEQWHYWAVSWHKGAGAFLYLDGQLVGQSASQPPNPINVISIGQPINKSVQNKVIDEFKIYDTALDSGAIARRYWQEGNFALNPELTVTPTQHPITIDGKITPDEWRNAAGFTGFIDSQTWKSELPHSWGKMTYDDQNLYVALHSDNPPEAKSDPDNTVLHGFVKRDAVKPGSAVINDDNFGMRIIPQTADGTAYSLYVNAINTIYGYSQSQDGSQKDWQSAAIVKSVLGMDGWSLEAAIPLQSLGITRVADDATWLMDFSRAWKMLRQRTDVWAPGLHAKKQTANTAMQFGTVHFATTTTAAASLQNFDIAKNGQITAQLHLSNPGSETQQFSATLSVADKVVQEQQFTLEPGARQNVTLQDMPKNANGALVRIAVMNGLKVLLSQASPLIIEQVGQLNLWKYPSLGQIRLGWVIQGNNDPASLHLSAQIKDAADKVVQKVEVPHLPAQNGSTLVDVKALTPGKYTVDVQVKNGNNVLQQKVLLYDKQPLPDWLGNTLGISNKVPPPWTDIQVNPAKDALSIWGRTYDYTGYLLPTQIVNQGKNMLAAPMRFVVKTANGVTQSSSLAKADDAKWTEVAANRSDSLRAQTIGSVAFKADSYTEFDGMTWMNLTISPQDKQTELEGLTIEIPLKAEWAKLIKPYDDYSLHNTGKLPADGWKGNASSMPWIGNGDGGFQFFQESTASWIGSKSSEIVPDGNGSVVLRVHLIDESVDLDKPLHFEFGWITSPVKAAPRDHRDWRMIDQWLISENHTSSSQRMRSYVEEAAALNPGIKQYALWWTEWWWTPPHIPNYTEPVPVPAEGKTNAIRDYDGITVYGAPYGRLTEMGAANPWFEQFGDEWGPSTSKFTPEENLSAGYQVAKVSQTSRSLRDFYAWAYNELLKDGKVQALYFDVSRPMSDTNIYHDAGTQMPDGSIEPTRNILGTRRVFQRIYTLMKERHPHGRIFYHTSGENMLPIDSFVDAMVDGENFNGLLDRKDNLGYENLLSIDQFRTEYSTQNNFGPASVFLPEFHPPGPIQEDTWKKLGYTKHAQYILGLILLHDSNVWWANFPLEVLSDAYSALEKIGWNSSWNFVPYWNQKVLSLPSGVNASMYQSPDGKKEVLVVMNTSGKDQQVSLPFTLGKSTLNTARMIYPQASMPLNKGKGITLQISSNNFQMVVLEK